MQIGHNRFSGVQFRRTRGATLRSRLAVKKTTKKKNNQKKQNPQKTVTSA